MIKELGELTTQEIIKLIIYSVLIFYGTYYLTLLIAYFIGKLIGFY